MVRKESRNDREPFFIAVSLRTGVGSDRGPLYADDSKPKRWRRAGAAFVRPRISRDGAELPRRTNRRAVCVLSLHPKHERHDRRRDWLLRRKGSASHGFQETTLRGRGSAR